MKRLALVALFLSLGGCGYSSTGGDMVGQAKKMAHATPLFCSPYEELDISMGVMQNGTGSISKEDLWLYVPAGVDLKALRSAVDAGSIIKVEYNVYRFSWCTPLHELTNFSVVK